MKRIFGVGIGCMALVFAAAVGYLFLAWWVTGILLDWANARFTLGLSGAVLVLVHILLLLVLSTILRIGSASATSK